MSDESPTVVGVVSGPPDGQQALQEEIERTREHLGQTVEALVAKVDVKARAQDEAGRLVGRLKATAIQARTGATARVALARQQAGDKTAVPRQRAASIRDGVAGQAGPPAAAAAAGISKVTPESVKRAAGNVAGTARQRRAPLAAAIGAVAAILVGWLLIKRRGQRE
jgi:Protein of unknown function (DUF3618)